MYVFVCLHILKTLQPLNTMYCRSYGNETGQSSVILLHTTMTVYSLMQKSNVSTITTPALTSIITVVTLFTQQLLLLEGSVSHQYTESSTTQLK